VASPRCGTSPPGTTPATSPTTTPAHHGKTKAEPSAADMTANLRRVLIGAKYLPVHPSEPTPAQIHAIQLA